LPGRQHYDDGNTHMRPWGPADDKLEEMKRAIRRDVATYGEACASCGATGMMAADSSHGPLCQNCAVRAVGTMRIPTKHRASPEALARLGAMVATSRTDDTIEARLSRIEATINALAKKWL
jgi:hypothetical protein